jgi:putative transposase
MLQAAEKMAKDLGVAAARRALGVPHSSLYRARHPKPVAKPRPTPERALSQAEKAMVRQELNSERFWDSSPRQVYATLLDEGTYLGHW